MTDAARRRAEAFAIDLVEPVQRLIFYIPLPTTQWLRQIADQLVASPADTRSVDEWATDAKVSTRALTRRFPAETGLTGCRRRRPGTFRTAVERHRFCDRQRLVEPSENEGVRNALTLAHHSTARPQLNS